MKTLLRIIAVLFIAIGAFLVYAVINAVSSEGGAKVGVAIGYVAGALVLWGLAWWMLKSAKTKGSPR